LNYYAHTAVKLDGNPDRDPANWQLLSTHLRNVAQLAKRFAEPLGLAAEAELSGLLHDLGKYSKRFQDRLHDNTIHGINHWAAGTAHAGETLKQLAVAFAVDGHHTGIPALDGSESLKQTVKRRADQKAWQEWTGCSESVPELLDRQRESDGIQLPSLTRRAMNDHFAEALRTRMLFSCLVDADFLDTEAHFKPPVTAERISRALEAERALGLLQENLAAKPADGQVNQRRRRLLSDCLAAAAKPPGLFTLTAPTGSGKTLSSLAFALQHIATHNATLAADDLRRFRRIIVVIPFTSIIEQTAQVYRDLFEREFGPDYVLEHHSAVAPRERPEDQGRDAEEERLRRARVAAENWAAPLVVTTSVQFFESLFSNRPSDCRKLHSIGRSVILFDEVQTLPPRLVPSLLSAVRLLTDPEGSYGATAVFMTATQPAFAAAGKALPYGWNPVEISSEPEAMAEALRRTRIELPARDETASWEDIAQRLLSGSQSLCVVNTTKDARQLFQLVRARTNDGCFHLSSRLCPAHRREKLDAIRGRLRDGLACRLVSTQLIEAGVDVDFPIAFRALGPLDSIIQTAGRCNREGRHPEPCPVIVFRPADGGLPRGAYGTAKSKTEEFLDRHPDASKEIHLPAFYAAYFSELYGLLGPQSRQDDPVFAASEALDFPKAAKECGLVGDETRAVLVKWKQGEELTEKLRREKHLTADECRRAQRYSVNLYQSEFFTAQARGYVYQPAEGWNFWVWNSDYNDDLGLGHLDLTEPV
jgi:CRISPR-associated helicase Cas3/CRISPR-associated endonuclease Cas3-HD